MTLEKLIDAILIDLKVDSKDDRLINLHEFIADKIHAFNQTLIRQQFTRTRKIDENLFSKVDCLETECVSTTCTIDGVTFTSKSDMFTVTIPDLVEGVGAMNIKYFGKVNFSENFTKKSIQGLKYMEGNLYTGHKPAYARVGNTFLIKNLPTQGTRVLSALLLLKNQVTACNWKSTDEYKTPSESQLQILVKKDLLSTWNIPYDEVNDGRGTVIVPRQKVQVPNSNE